MARSSTTWQKGTSGNPNGTASPHESPTALLRRALAQPYEGGDGQQTRLALLIEAAVQRLVRDALAGDLRLADLNLVLQRLDGSPVLGLPVEDLREMHADLEQARLRAAQSAESSRGLARLRASGQWP